METYYLVERYIKAVKNNISQDIVDLILFMYTQPIMMNIKLIKSVWYLTNYDKDKIKSVWYLPTEPDWKSLQTKIADAFEISITPELGLQSLYFDNGTVITRSHWNTYICRWKQTHIFTADFYDFSHLGRQTKQANAGLERYYKIQGVNDYNNKFLEW
eukprot:68117_1